MGVYMKYYMPYRFLSFGASLEVSEIVFLGLKDYKHQVYQSKKPIGNPLLSKRQYKLKGCRSRHR